MVWRCRLFGHDYSFRAEARTMVWECSRGCGARDSKEYATSAEAERYAAAFDPRDKDQLGKRAPLIGLFPLRLWRRLRPPRRSR